MPKSTEVTFRVAPQVKRDLQILAASDRRTLGGLCRVVLEQTLATARAENPDAFASATSAGAGTAAAA